MKKLLLIVCLLLLPNPSAAQSSLLADLQAERSHYGASMTSAQVAEMLNAVAWAHRSEGWGMLRKGSGNSCPLRDTYISCDILIHAPSINHYDTLIDAEGRAEPTWNLVGPCVLGPSSGCEMSRFLAPFDPGGGTVAPGPTPTPQPVPSPVQTDLAPVLSKLDALYAQSERMFAQWQFADAAERERDAELAKKVDNPGWFSAVFGNRYVQLALAGVGTWLGAMAAK